MLTAVGALVSTFRIKTRPQARRREPTTARTILAGLHFIWREKMVLGAISLDLFAVLLGGAVALLPVYAREILHTGPWGLGLLRTAPGVGAAVMAVALAHRPLRGRAGLTLLWSVAGFGICTILFGVSTSLVLSLLALIFLGASDMVSVIIRATLVQLRTPDEMRGRVNAVDMVFIGASNELGQFESGLTAQWFGTVPAVLLGGVGTLMVIALWAWRFPELRRAGNSAPSRAPQTMLWKRPRDCSSKASTLLRSHQDLGCAHVLVAVIDAHHHYVFRRSRAVFRGFRQHFEIVALSHGIGELADRLNVLPLARIH